MPTPSSSFWPQWDDQPVFTVLLALFLVTGVFWAGSEAYRSLQEATRVGYGEQAAPSISVNAEGKAVVKNDIATVDVGVTKSAADASEAQNLATEAMNLLTAAMKELGVAEDDLQTSSYYVYPQYDYEESPPTIVGYEASQTLTVKVRESDVVSAVLGKAAELGATNIGSLRFEADDDSAAEEEARKEAIAEARAQAEATAEAMGATLGDVISYSESRGDMGGYYAYAESSARDLSVDSMAPDVQMGQSEVQLYVYITYGLK